MYMAEALSCNGNDVTLMAKKGELDFDPFEYYKIKNKFNLIYFRHINLRFLGNLIYALRLACKVLNTRKCDLIYTRFPFWALFFIPQNVRIIYESHSLPNSKFRAIAEKRLLNNKSISKFVLISDALKEDYYNLWPWLDKSILYVAPDAAKSPDDCDIGTKPDSSNISVGYVGSFYKGKSIEILSELIERCGDIDFHLIGDTGCVPQQYSKALESMNVIKHGYIKPSELSKYYKFFDIALLPIGKHVHGANQKQDISRWTSPLKLFEYMGNKKCIIASNLPVIREVLEKDRNSLLVDVDDLDGWVNAIKRVANDSSLRNKLVENASEDFENKFTWEIRAKNIMNKLATSGRKID